METFRSSGSPGKGKRSGSRPGSYQNSRPLDSGACTGLPVFDADYFDCTFARPDGAKKSQGSESQGPRHPPKGVARGNRGGTRVVGTEGKPQPREPRCPADGEIIHKFWEDEPENKPADSMRSVGKEKSRIDGTLDMQLERTTAQRLPFYWGACLVLLLISLLAYLTYRNDFNFGFEAMDSSPARHEAQSRFGQAVEKDARGSDVPQSVTHLLSVERTASPGDARTGLSVKRTAAATAPVAQERPPLPRPRSKTDVVSPEEDQSSASVTLGTILSQLQVVELQQKGYELALELMNARPGAFSGFFPDRSIPGISYVRKFESRIVELEMRKKALAVNFNPNSREIQSIDQEIKGIRDSVKEYIGEQLVFLRQRKEMLLAQKHALERKVGSRGPSKAGSKVLWLPHDSSFDGRADLWLHEEESEPGQPMRARGSDNTDGPVSRVLSGLASFADQTKEKLKSFPFSCSLDAGDMPRQPYEVVR